MSFTIRSETFEGPIELLLSLIESRKLFINEISLAAVTEEYLAYLQKDEVSHTIKNMTAFVLVAATLILIKSKSLLPTLDLSQEEESSIVDLEDRLRAYKAFQKRSQIVKELLFASPSYFKGETGYQVPHFSPDPRATLPLLLETLRGVIRDMPQKELVQTASLIKIISLEEMVEHIEQRIKDSLKKSFSFSEIRSSHSYQKGSRDERVYTAVSFLAILELSRLGILHLEQDHFFSEIALSGL